MDQYLTKFLSTLAASKGYSGNTIAAYRNDMEQFAKFLQSHQGNSTDGDDCFHCGPVLGGNDAVITLGFAVFCGITAY